MTVYARMSAAAVAQHAGSMKPAAEVWLRSTDAIACYPLIGMVSVGLSLMTAVAIRYLALPGSPDVAFRPTRRHDGGYDITHQEDVEHEGRHWVSTYPFRLPEKVRSDLVHHLGLDGRLSNLARP